MSFRYAQIIGDVFYCIKLTKEQARLVDEMFINASHHFYCLRISQEPEDEIYHEKMMWRSVKVLMNIVAQGNFSEAIDTGKDGCLDLSKQENWVFNGRLPHPLMFDRACREHDQKSA